MKHFLLVNFGGPRDLDEVAPFLKALLRDRDVTGTALPKWLHHLLFGYIARRRSVNLREDYQKIGGRSPIYFDTEAIAEALSKKTKSPVLTFHRYLPATHSESLKKIEAAKELVVLPLFPQFSYSTTGSIARFFSQRLKKTSHLFWVKSYPSHPAFIDAYRKRIEDFLDENDLQQEETVLFFSPHGLPQSYVDRGDPYESECQMTYQCLASYFPKTLPLLAYQSRFGRAEWLKPYTIETCEAILSLNQRRKNVVFIPISFTSDHIETLFEIEEQYLPIIRSKGLNAYRCPSLNLEPYWLEAICRILEEKNTCENQMLIR